MFVMVRFAATVAFVVVAAYEFLSCVTHMS